MPPRSLQLTAFATPSRIDELCTGGLTPGRNLEQLRNGNRLYSVRLNRKFRFVFMVMEDSTGRAIAVGPHDMAYETAKRVQS